MRNERPLVPSFHKTPMPDRKNEDKERNAMLVMTYFHPFTLYSIASRIPPGRVEDQGDMKDVIANRFSMCTLELNDVVLVFDVVVM